MALTPGTRLGPYLLVELLSEGATGAVFRARDERLGRDVAIKMLATRFEDEEAQDRFRREALATAALAHKNVLRLHEASFAAPGSGNPAWHAPYHVLELAAGGSLEQRIRTRGRLPWPEVARIGAGLARGLAAAHGAGLVHRDLKPANVLFDEEETPKLADFGLVLAGDSRELARRLTRTGAILGTPGFLAPEQVDQAKGVGPASDLYGLGATLYAALTGHAPFEGTETELIYRVLHSRADPVTQHVPEVPDSFDRLLARLLEKDVALRPRSADDVARELDAILAGGLPESKSSRPPRRSRWLVAALVALPIGALVWLLGGALGAASPGGESPPPGAPRHASPGPTRAPSPEARLTPPPPTTTERFQSVFDSTTHLRLEHVFGDVAWKSDQPLTAAATSPDGTFAITGGGNDPRVRAGLLTRWDLTTGRDVWSVLASREDSGSVSAVAVSPDGKLVGAAGTGWLVLRDAASGTPVAETRLPLDFGAITTLAFSLDGALLAAGSAGDAASAARPEAIVWRPGDLPRLLEHAQGHKEGAPITAVAWLGSGDVVTAGEDGRVLLWKDAAATVAPTVIAERALLEGHGFASLATDGATILWGERRYETLGLSTPAGLQIAMYPGDRATQVSVAMISSASGWHVLASSNRQVRRYDSGDLGFKATTVLATPRGELTHLRVLPGGRRFFGVCPTDASIGLWDLESGKDLRPAREHLGAVRSIALGDGGKTLITGGGDGRVVRWSTRAGETSTLSSSDGTAVNGVTFLGPRPLLACASGVVEVLDRKVTICPPGPPARAVTTVGPARSLAIGCRDEPVVFAFPEADPIVPVDRSLKEFLGDVPVSAAATDASGRAIVVGGSRVVEVPVEALMLGMNLRGIGLLFEVPLAKGSEISAFDVAPDGVRFLVGEASGPLPGRMSLFIAGAKRTARQVSFPEHGGAITAAAIIPGRDLAVTASIDRTLRLWSIAENEPRALESVDLGPVFDHVSALVVARDGRTIYAGTARGIVLALGLAMP